MHLVVFVEEFYPNTSGGGLTRWRFCQKAVERGHQVTVFTPRRPGLARMETVDGVDIRRPARIRPAGPPPYSVLGILARIVVSIALFAQALAWLRGRSIDGIHAAEFAMYWVGKVLSIVYGVAYVPMVGYTPSTSGAFRPTPKYLLERLNFRLFMGEEVLCRDPDVKAVLDAAVDGRVTLLHGILQAPDIRAAHERVDRSAVRSRFDIGPDETLLAYVGRLVPIKNASAAVEALAALPDPYRLVIVGDGPDRPSVESAVATHGVDERVTLVGQLPHDETLEVLAAADAVVLTSDAESYSAVALEALALGCHVYSTPVGVLTELDHGRLHVGEVSDMAERISATGPRNEETLDEATLEGYSMERYTDDVLAAFERQTETGAAT